MSEKVGLDFGLKNLSGQSSRVVKQKQKARFLKGTTVSCTSGSARRAAPSRPSMWSALWLVVWPSLWRGDGKTMICEDLRFCEKIRL
jgi:hypothetical protein